MARRQDRHPAWDLLRRAAMGHAGCRRRILYVGERECAISVQLRARTARILDQATDLACLATPPVPLLPLVRATTFVANPACPVLASSVHLLVQSTCIDVRGLCGAECESKRVGRDALDVCSWSWGKDVSPCRWHLT